MVPAPSLSSTPNSFAPLDYEILSPDKHIWGRLAESDQSLTVSFHNSYVAVSFDIAQNITNMGYAESWVEVGLLNLTEQLKPSSGYENVIPLEDIQEDSEVEVSYDITDSQRVLFIHWKRQVISIQYHVGEGLIPGVQMG